MEVNDLLSPLQQQQIRKIALTEYGSEQKECCGFLLSDGEIYPCENQSKSPSQEFIIETALYAALEKEKGIAAIFHSHTNGSSKFSAADIDLVNRTQKPLVLYTVAHNEFKAVDPSGKTPLIGRHFVYGVYDCFSLVRDYYAQEKGIKLPNYHRSSDKPVWDQKEWDWIDTEYERVGFKKVSSPDIGDVIAMSIGNNAMGINHLAIYLGDNLFLHQLNSRKSNKDIWGSPWDLYTIKFLRYFGNETR